MTLRVKGSSNVLRIRWIPRYTLLERAMHWLHTATFVPLAITGFIMYTPWLQSLAQGESGQLIRLWHRIFAIGFGVVPITYVIFQPRRAIMSFKEFMFGRDDIEWAKNAVAYYLLGKHGVMPPQGRFNTGEKMNGLIMILSWIVFAITGLGMWFYNVLGLSAGLFQWMVFFHDLAFIVSVSMFFIHFFLAVVHPLMWQGLVSIRFGYTSASYAAEHHAKWYYGEKRAKEMWEQARKEGH
ncbi:MAG: formate dehydrogenase subunit gamma [Chloroflexota bacterium]